MHAVLDGALKLLLDIIARGGNVACTASGGVLVAVDELDSLVIVWIPTERGINVRVLGDAMLSVVVRTAEVLGIPSAQAQGECLSEGSTDSVSATKLITQNTRTNNTGDNTKDAFALVQ
ncbi:hypothetical protein FRC12_000743, partial [Ceratobasidium sp. 428]